MESVEYDQLFNCKQLAAICKNRRCADKKKVEMEGGNN